MFVAAACTDDFEEKNIDPKRAGENVPAETLFSNAQKNLTDIVTSANVNRNIFRLLAQYWTQTTYTDESRYDLSTRNIPQNFWNILYRDVLRDLLEARDLVNADPELDAAVKANQLAMIEIMAVYTWAVIVNTYGDVPYTQALDVANVYPVYEDDAAIYSDLIARLDNALAALKTEAAGFEDGDLLYGGTIASWIRFGNSLKLKLGMTIADVDPARARTLVEAAAPNVFMSNADNASFQYLNTPPNTNPIWVDLVQSGRRDFVAANTLLDRMQALGDPRLAAYFTTVVIVPDDPNTEADETVMGYRGGLYGRSNSYSSFSKPDEAITDPEFEALLLDYAEVEFFLAEAVARGFNVGATAEEHYNNGIRASMAYWGITDAALVNAYLARPDVAYTSPGSGAAYRQKIGIQKWIALYNRGHEGWTEWRRLDAPALQYPERAVLPAIPVRFPYPVQEQNLNRGSYNAAASAIGGDLPSTRVFWDVN